MSSVVYVVMPFEDNTSWFCIKRSLCLHTSSSRVCLEFPALIKGQMRVDCPGLIAILYIHTAVAGTAYTSCTWCSYKYFLINNFSCLFYFHFMSLSLFLTHLSKPVKPRLRYTNIQHVRRGVAVDFTSRIILLNS